MKIYLIILQLFFLYNISAGQTNQELIQLLYSEHFYDNWYAILEIMDRNVIEATDDIMVLYDESPALMQVYFIRALCRFEHPGTKQLAHEFLLNVDSYPEDKLFIDPLQAKVKVTDILFALDDYTTYYYVFDLIDRDGILNITPAAFNLLSEIINNIPSKEMDVKNIYLTLWSDSPEEYSRYHSMVYLTKKYGSEMNNLHLNSFLNDEDEAIKSKALKYLINFSFNGLQNILRERLILDNSHTMRLDIAEYLLKHYGAPADLKTVIDYQPLEPNITSNSLMSYLIKEFIVRDPDPSVPDAELVQNLIEYTEDMIQFEWILPGISFDFLSAAKLVKSFYDRENYSEAIETLDSIRDAALTAFNKSELTLEGFKYLKAYPEFIRYRLKELI